MMEMPGANIGLAHPVLEKGNAAGDGGAGNRAGEMTQQAGRFVPVEHHRHGLRLHLAGIEAPDRLFAGDAADLGGASQIAGMAGAGMVVIALHAGAFARQNGDADGMAGAGIAAEKAGARWPARWRGANRRRRRLRNW